MNLHTQIRNLSRFKRYAPKLQTIHGATADVFAVAGAVLIVAGVRDIYRPAAFIFAGAFLLVFSFAMTRTST